MDWKAIMMSVVILLSSLVFLISNDTGVDAVGEPTIKIELAQTKQTAYVAPGQDGVVTFTGIVTATAPWSPNVQYLVVTLHASCNDWPVSVPPSLTFHKGIQQQSFALSVQVPIGTPVSTRATLVISGTWSYSPGVMSGEIDPVTAQIIIRQYYDYQISPIRSVSYVERGDIGKVPILVDNLGNGKDMISLEIENSNILIEDGIAATLPSDHVTVEYNDSEETYVILTLDDSVMIGVYGLDLAAYSETAERNGDIHEKVRTTAYFEVVREGDLLEPEPEPEPDDDEPPVDDGEEQEEGSGSESASEMGSASDSGGISTNMIFIMMVAVVLFFLLLGVYFIIRMRKSTG